MKKEANNEKKNKKRKHNGIEINDDFNRERWNMEDGYFGEEEMWIAKYKFEV